MNPTQFSPTAYLEKLSADAKKRLPEIFTAEQLMKAELPEPRWAVPGFLVSGLSILAGKPKKGKSFLARQVALAVATGGEVLGQNVEQGEVLVLALEDTPRRLQDLLRDMFPDGKVPATLRFTTKWPRLDRGGLEKLSDELRDRPKTRLVVVDTLARIRPQRPRGADPYQHDTDVMASLKEIADRFNVSVLVIHHVRKAESDDPADLVSGTLGTTGPADTTLVLRRKSGTPDGFLYVTGRDIEEKETALRFSYPMWSVLGNADEYRLTEERQDVIKFLKLRKGQALGAKEISEGLEKGYESTRKLLQRMLTAGEIQSPSSGLYEYLSQ